MRAGELFGALRERRFRLLWIGQATSTLGDGLVPVALSFAVIQTLNGSATDLGIVLAAHMLPLVLFVLAGGVWADRLPRQGPGDDGDPAPERLGRALAPRRAGRDLWNRGGVLPAGRNRGRPRDDQRRAAPTGERAPRSLAQHGVRDRTCGRRRDRGHDQPRDRLRSRRGDVRRQRDLARALATPTEPKGGRAQELPRRPEGR